MAKLIKPTHAIVHNSMLNKNGTVKKGRKWHFWARWHYSDNYPETACGFIADHKEWIEKPVSSIDASAICNSCLGAMRAE